MFRPRATFPGKISVYALGIESAFAGTEKEECEMTKTITGSYDASLKIRNAKDDLIASGIDREKIFPDEDHG